MLCKNLDDLVILTKKVEKYREVLKPQMKSHSGIKSNFYGDQKKLLDSINNKFIYYSSEIKKHRRNINFIIPEKEFNNIKSTIASKQEQIQTLKKEDQTLQDIINIKTKKLEDLQNNELKIDDYYKLYEEYKELRIKFNEKCKLKNELVHKSSIKDNQLNNYYEKVKTVNEKMETLRLLKLKNGNLVKNDIEHTISIQSEKINQLRSLINNKKQSVSQENKKNPPILTKINNKQVKKLKIKNNGLKIRNFSNSNENLASNPNIDSNINQDYLNNGNSSKNNKDLGNY